jgi:hypothetical protein
MMMRGRLLVADPRLRPSVPETFSSDEEYTRTFVGFMLEEIRQEASEAIEAREPISAFWVQALDEHKVSRQCTHATRRISIFASLRKARDLSL